jgi:hypothetical protein
MATPLRWSPRSLISRRIGGGVGARQSGSRARDPWLPPRVDVSSRGRTVDLLRGKQTAPPPEPIRKWFGEPPGIGANRGAFGSGPSGAEKRQFAGTKRRTTPNQVLLPCRRSWVRVPSAASLNSLQTSPSCCGGVRGPFAARSESSPCSLAAIPRRNASGSKWRAASAARQMAPRARRTRPAVELSQVRMPLGTTGGSFTVLGGGTGIVPGTSRAVRNTHSVRPSGRAAERLTRAGHPLR